MYKFIVSSTTEVNQFIILLIKDRVKDTEELLQSGAIFTLLENSEKFYSND